MKSRKMKLIIYFLFSYLVVSLQGTAQDWFSKNELGSQVDGYIIGIAGDTIYGSLEYSYPISMQKRPKAASHGPFRRSPRCHYASLRQNSV